MSDVTDSQFRIKVAADQLERYGSLRDDRLLEVLELLAEMNDDMQHARMFGFVHDSSEKAIALLKAIAAEYVP